MTASSRSATNARTSASKAVKRSAIHSIPAAASRDESSESAKWKTTRAPTTKSSIAGTVSRERSSTTRSFRVSATTSER